MEEIKKRLRIIQLNIRVFFKWIIISVIIGLISGVIGSIFHISVEFATRTRIENPWILYLLPFGGLMIVFL